MFYLAGRRHLFLVLSCVLGPMQSSNLKIAYGHATAIKSGAIIIIIISRIVIILLRCTDPDVHFVPFPAFRLHLSFCAKLLGSILFFFPYCFKMLST